MMQEMNKNINEYALPFAAWELRLYLNTNPDDERALAAFRQLCAAQGNDCNYACHVGDMRGMPRGGNGSGCGCGQGTHDNGHHGDGVWHWIDGPWPWEYDGNMKGGC